ncbi:MAG: hypothetical protein L6Q78_01120 [Bacteroidia bacterium]|nr:hypothetical protein [Bacteroidia bacterium]
MEILVAYFSELVLTLAVVSLVYLILLTRFSNRAVSDKSVPALSNKSFAFVFMGLVDEKILFERIQETDEMREKGHEFFFFIDRPFVQSNQLAGIHIFHVDEKSFRPETMLEMVAYASRKEPGFLVMLNPVKSFSEFLVESLELKKSEGFSFFELQSGSNPLDEMVSTSKSFLEIKNQVAQVLFNNPVEGFPAAVVVGDELFNLLPGQFAQIVSNRFQSASNSKPELPNQFSIASESESNNILGERLLLPHFHLLLMRFHARLNGRVFVHSFTKSLALRFSSQLCRILFFLLAFTETVLIGVDYRVFTSFSPFIYLSLLSISVLLMILLAEGLKSGAESAFNRFHVKRSFRHNKYHLEWEA